jgi:Protein of unknown function (DUF3105)
VAKKKRKRKRTDRPVSRAGTATAVAEPTADERPSARAARKEQARQERERRIKQAKRRQRTRRAVRWGVVLAAAGGIGWFVWGQVQENREVQERAAAAAARVGIGEIQEPADEGTEHLQPTDPPPQYGTIPAASGPHAATPLPAEPRVYDQPIPETAAVHNLEHGYVLIYYRAEGEGALEEAVVTELEGLAEGETEVIMAPHESLAEGTNLAFAAWTRIQEGQVPADADPADVALVARAFIEEFKNGAAAPEAEVS